MHSSLLNSLKTVLVSYSGEVGLINIQLVQFVTYWTSTEPSIKRYTCINNRCIRSKISRYHLDLWTSWIRCNCNAHRKQVDVKQLYNQVSQTVWVIWISRQKEFSSSCSWGYDAVVRASTGLGPSGPRLSSPAEWGSAAIARGTWGQYFAFCYRLQHTSHT